MSLFRALTRPKQRTDSIDFNRTNDLGLSNLELSLRHFLVFATGIMRGGTVSPDSGMFVKVGALAGITSTGRALILEVDTSAGPFASNNSGNPRVDLVSAYISDDQAAVETRKFINSDVNPVQKFDQDVSTKIETKALLRITQGTPASNPVAPALPAGHIALAEVRINNGQTQINSGSITQRYESRVAPQRAKKTADTSGNISFPWESDRLEKVVTPAGATTVLEGQVEYAPVGFSSSQMVILEVIDKTNADAVVARATYAPNVANPLMTFSVRGAVEGPRGPADYALRLRRSDGAGGTTLWPATNIILIARTF